MSGERRTMIVNAYLNGDVDPRRLSVQQLAELHAQLAKEIGEGIVQKLFEFNKVEWQPAKHRATVALDVIVPPTPANNLTTRDFGLAKGVMQGDSNAVLSVLDLVLRAGAG